MRRVYKYEVGSGEPSTTLLPIDAEVVHVAPIAGKMYVWATTDPDRADPAVTERRQIAYFATGEQIPDGADHVGTGITPDGAFVWHVFERRVGV